MGAIVSGGRTVTVRDSAYVQVRESITDVTRQIEDLTWTSLTNDTRGQNLDDIYDQRRQLLARIRLYRRRNPLAKMGAVLLQHYVLGRGITTRANNKAKVARIIDEFMNDPENVVTFTGQQAMAEGLDTLFTDGNLFLVLDVDSVLGSVHLKTIDAMFVEDIITDPDNFKVPRWYKVRKPSGKYDFTTGAWQAGLSDEFVYYRDWHNDNESFAPSAKQIEPGLIFHMAINKRGKFGESEMAAAVDWIKTHKDFLEGRASLNAAAAQIAWKKTRKGGAASIAGEVNALRSSLSTNINSWETNPTPAPASTLVQNQGTDTEWMKTETGGANALSDERIMRMMAGAGMGGIPNHYFGDEAAANLASATSMELPLLKNYESWQQLLSDSLQALFEFVLTVAHDAGRIGDRDDSRKYADRVTTPANVLQLPGATGASGATSAGAANAPQTGLNREASASTGPEAPIVQIELIPKQEYPSVLAGDDDDTGAIDWYVGVDFPLIVQKDLNIQMASIKALYEIMPASNIESQKLAVELSLQALSVDVDETMERIFPPELLSPQVVNSIVSMSDKLGPAIAPTIGGAPMVIPPELPPGGPIKESDDDTPVTIHAARVRHVLRIARDASDALSRVGS